MFRKIVLLLALPLLLALYLVVGEREPAFASWAELATRRWPLLAALLLLLASCATPKTTAESDLALERPEPRIHQPIK
ncbi:hypothetical protein [Hymenobacter latericus]|uniref:hypothetical protein n=1 Tax=Hymenobacter sp. YIM 151858-1 TaxID=2987688 RepID=UPI002227C480|nr:hypothetical protein [Hymenobacter sp. YIM 151858-1]UYZ60164.1 hypothetical protein OIS50_05015 [Hymenobacter sp. YIM 151858-1]